MTRRRGVLLIIVFALGLALVVPIARRTTEGVIAESSQPCMDIATRDHIRQLMMEGLDQAFRAHLGGLFDVWMKDRDVLPTRAQKGMQAGVSAYTRSRKSAVTWQPTCVAE